MTRTESHRRTSWREEIFVPRGTTVKFPNGVVVGAEEIVVMAGPCSVESREQILSSARLVAAAGSQVFAGRRVQNRAVRRTASRGWDWMG